MLRQLILITLLFCSINLSYGRNRVVADSCLQILNSSTQLSEKEKCQLLLKILHNSEYNDQFFEIVSQLKKKANKIGSPYYQFYAWYEKGQALSFAGKHEDAIFNLLNSLGIAETNDLNSEIGLAKYALSLPFYSTNNYELALFYLKEAIKIYTDLDQQNYLGGCYYQLGNIYMVQNINDSALHYYTLASKIINPSKSPHVFAYMQGNIGILQSKQNLTDSARVNLKEAISKLKDLNDMYAMIPFLLYASQNENKSERYNFALSYADEALKNANELNHPELIRDSYEQLARTYYSAKDYKNAFDFLDLYIHLKDSIINIERVTALANLRTDYEISLKQAEVDKLTISNQMANWVILITAISLLLASLFSIIIWRQNQQKNRLNQTLSSQTEALHRNKKELEINNRSKDKLFSILAHDLRSPIGAITSLTNCLKDAIDQEDRKEAQEIALSMGDASKQVEFLLNNLLYWSISQQNIYQPVPKPLNITALIKGIIQLYTHNAQTKNITIHFSCPYSTIKVEIDPNCWGTICRNLINNAVKFTPSGGVINVNLYYTSGQVHLEVIDNGIGMTSEQTDALFKPGNIKSSWGTMNEKGQGLGLLLVKDFVTINKGTLKVVSKPEKGTTFTVTLPAVLLEIKTKENIPTS